MRSRASKRRETRDKYFDQICREVAMATRKKQARIVPKEVSSGLYAPSSRALAGPVFGQPQPTADVERSRRIADPLV